MGSTLILGAIMVLGLAGGVCEAWRGHMGRCALFFAVGLGVAGYAVLLHFVPGAHK
jgi:hypothetical protein